MNFRTVYPGLFVLALLVMAPLGWAQCDVTFNPLTGLLDCTGGSGLAGGGSNLTTVNAIPYVSAPGVLDQDASNFFWDSNNHRLGIGTNAPSVPLQTQIDSNSAATVLVVGNANTGGSTQTRVELSRGSDGGTRPNKGNVLFAASSQSGLADYEARPLDFYTGTVAGSATVRMRIATSGPIGIGPSNTSPTGTLHVKDASSGGATKLTVVAGDTQSTTNLQEWQNSSGTVLVSVSSAGVLTGNGPLSLAASPSTNINLNTSSGGQIVAAGHIQVYVSSNASVLFGTTPDTSLSRVSAGVVGVGTGAAGSVAGKIKLTEVIWVSGTESTCDSFNRGRAVMVQGSTGVADTFRICGKDASDSYAWRSIY